MRSQTVALPRYGALDAATCAGYIIVFAAALVAVRAFFGSYAVDDSYIGFSNAQNLADGRGFVFTPGQQALTTSAPLAVFVYAALQRYAGMDIVAQSQWVSAISVVLIALFAYAVALRLVQASLAAVVSVTLTLSPLLLLLWSHETLPAVALSLGALCAVTAKRRKPVTGGLALGAAALMRPESLLLLPLLAFYIRRDDRGSALRFAIAACVPVAAWSAYAIAVFGHIVSQSVAAKHAQLLYGGTSYLPGLLSRTAHVYAALVPVRFVRSLVVPAIASGVILLLFARRGRTVYGYCALWALAVTALYVVVQVPFYYWFAMQVPVIAAVAGGGLLWDAFPSDGARIAARCVGAFIVCATLLSFVTLLARPQLKYTEIDSMLVLPHIARNPYFMLATWLRENTAPQDSVAYPEIGQLRYYSGRPVVDYEGLSTPGVVARMLQGNMIWAFERYRPSVYVQREGSWSFLVDPLEFEWFGRAYARVKTLRYDLDGHRQTFVIYRLKSRAVVPAPEEIDVRGAASVVASSAGSAQVQVVPSVRGVNALEMRVAGACARGRMSVLRRGDLLAQRTVHFAGATHRLRIAFAREADSAGMPYRVVLNGCQGIRLAPPLRLRTGLQLYTNAVRTVGRPADALAVYWRP